MIVQVIYQNALLMVQFVNYYKIHVINILILLKQLVSLRLQQQVKNVGSNLMK